MRKLPLDLLKRLDAIYAQIPSVACKGLCAEACGPIPLTSLEALRLQQTAHKKPRLLPEVKCVYLTDRNRCSVYAVRPTICRLWGVLKNLSCMHGCVPERWVSSIEAVKLIQEVEKIGGQMLATGPDGVVEIESVSSIDLSQIPPETIAHYDEMTLGLRALHGGRILGVTPGEGKWIDVDKD